MANMQSLYERLKRQPRVGDKAITHYGCYREVVSTTRNSITSSCSNPKTCPNKGNCDLSQAQIHGRKP